MASSYTLPELCKDFTCETCSVFKRSSAMNGIYKTISFEPSHTCITMLQIIDACKPGIYAAFEEIMRKRIKCKVNFGIQILFHKIDFSDGSVMAEDRGYMSVNAMVVQPGVNLDDLIEEARADLEEKIETFTNKGSNWIVGAIIQYTLAFVAFK